MLAVGGGVGVALFPSWAWQNGVRTALGGLTGGEADFASLELRDDGAIVRGLTVSHPSGTRVLFVDRVDVACDPATLATDHWVLEEVVFEGVRVDLDESGDDLALPPDTWALVWGNSSSESAPRLTIDTLRVVDATFEGTGRKGTLAGTLERAEVSGVELEAGAERPIAIRSGSLQGFASTVDGRELADVERLDLDPDGVFALTGLEATTALQESGWPVWPPLVELWIPRWAGGRAESTGGGGGPWWGWRPARWVWIPDHGTVEGRVVLSDGLMALRPKTWVVTGVKGSIGPASKTLPYSVRGWTAGGPFRADGRVTSGGRVSAKVVATDMEAAEFDPYLAVNLQKFGVEIREGKLNADLDLALQGSRFESSGTVALTKVRFNRTSAFSGLNKALLTTASWLLGGKDKTFTADVAVVGDFGDPRFSPFRQLFGQVSAAIVRDAGRRVGKGATTVKDTAGKLIDKVFKRRGKD